MNISLNYNKIFKELKDQEWKSFQIENIDNGIETTIFIKSIFTIDSYSLIITDLNLVWYKYSNLESIKNDKIQFNEHLDSPIEKILDILRDTINSTQSSTLTSTTFKLSIPNKNHNYKLSFTILKKISFYSFKWIFNCEPIEDIIDQNSWKIHSNWIKDNFIIPLMYCCKNLNNSKKLLEKQLDKTLKYVNNQNNNNNNNINNNINNNNNNNNSNNNSTLSTSFVNDSKKLNLPSTSSTSKRIGLNIYQALPILSETIIPEEFKENDYQFFNNPIFSQYYNNKSNTSDDNDYKENDNDNDNNNNNLDNSIIDDNQYYNSINNFDDDNNNNDNNIDLNETIEDNFINKSSSSKSNTNNITSTTTTTELSLFYDVCTTPKKNYSNGSTSSRNRTKSNNISSGNSNIISLPSSISNIQPNSLSSISSLNSYTSSLSTTISNNNLKVQFDESINNHSNDNDDDDDDDGNGYDDDEVIEEKKRKLELEEKIEHSKQKQLNKKKKTKFV